MKRQVAEERIQERIVEETDVPVSLVMEKIIEVAKHVPQERVQNYTVEQLVDATVPRIRKETGRVIQITPQDRIPDRVVEQSADVSVTQAKVPAVQTIQRTAGVMKNVSQHEQQRTVEQSAQMPEVAETKDDLDAGAGNQRSAQQQHRSKQHKHGNQQQSTRQVTQEKTEERVEEERRKKGCEKKRKGS